MKNYNTLLLTIIFWTCLYRVECGPIQRYIRVIREIYPEIEPEKVDGNQPQVCVVGDVVYEAEEIVPADQPCLKCKCQPPGVHCEAIRCLKKPGCRAIHKPNKCCPDYQCECEHEGNIYANGERLESKPGGECQVCYCRGGEVQCTEVSCYIRTDCEGKTVPGQCCPKYEHCPAIEPSSGKISPKPDSEEHEATTKAFADPATNASAENEIGETTLPLEKDDTLISLVESTTSDSLGGKFREGIEDTNPNNIPKITIHEIIPEIKEIPITEPPKQEDESVVQGQLLVEEKVPAIANEEDLENHANDVEDSDLESSELSEVFQHPPPVLRIGDQLLFLKKGELVPEKDASTPSPVFTIIGAEGLQRGDIESMEHHETQKETENSSSAPSSETPLRVLVTNNEDIIEESQKNKTESATETSKNTLKTNDNTTIDIAVELANANLDEQIEDVDLKNETSAGSISTTKKPVEEEQKIKIEEIVQLENPAYPPIPEIMSQQGTEYIDHGDIVETISKDNSEGAVESSTVDNTKILPEILPFRKNGSIAVAENITDASWLKQGDDVGSLINEKAALPDEILKEVAPSDLDITTDVVLVTTNENSKQGKRSSDFKTDATLMPYDGFKDEDLLRYGTIVESDPLVENQVKKLADEDGVVGSASSLPYEGGRSTETLENSSEDVSGEYTTPRGVRNLHASILDSKEDASVEAVVSSEENKSKKDVEIIDPVLLASHHSNTNLTHEENSKETRQDRVEKRTISTNFDPESEKIFQELDTELHILNGDQVATKSDEEEKKEAEIIFKELLDEVNASTSKTPKQNAGKGEDSDVLQRVSDAIAKFQLKEARQSLDVNILSILRDFFTSQYRSYKDV